MNTAIDMELFINEIRNRPEIWDSNCEEYKFKNRRWQAWTEIATIVIPEFGDLPMREKDDVFKMLSNKWRNVRDSFVRINKKGNTKQRDYLYLKHLNFLHNIYPKTNSEDEADSEDSRPCKRRSSKRKIEVCWQSDEDQETKKKTETNALEFVESIIPDAIIPDASCSMTSFTSEDDDRSFFESLLPAVRKFHLDQKLEFRSEVICLIKNIRRQSTKKIKPDPSGYE